MNEETNQSQKENNNCTKENNSEEYQYGLDIVRFSAMFSVVVFHGLTANHILTTKIDSIIIFISNIILHISYACNGLFMILTGYLKRNKKSSSSYFSKLIQFIVEYILCSILCVIYRKYKEKEKLTKQQIIEGLFTFTDVTHGWFVRMYIGLFLLSPYLNILYNNINSIKVKYELIIIIIIVYSLPQSYTLFGWRYWGTGYPIMYYLIGCYIREYQPYINRIYIIIIIIIISILMSLLAKYSSKAIVNNCENIGSVTITTLIFLFFYNLKAKKKNCLCKIFRIITNTSFSFFLLDYFFEELFYFDIFPKKGYKKFIETLPHLLYVIPITTIGGILLSLFNHILTMYLMKIIYYIYDKFIEYYFNGKDKELIIDNVK